MTIASAVALCLTAGGVDRASAARKRVPMPVTPVEAYMQGRLAQSRGDLSRAAVSFRQALVEEQLYGNIAANAYRTAVIAGDMPLAVRAAKSLRAKGGLPRDGLILLLVDALNQRQPDEVATVSRQMAGEQTVSLFAAFGTSWASLQKGSYAPPVISPTETFGTYARRQLDEQVMLQKLVLGDGEGAAVALETMRAAGIDPLPDMRGPLAQRFAELGKVDVALSLLKDDPTPNAVSLRQRLEAGQKLTPAPAPSPAQGIAVLTYRLARGLGGGSTRDISVLSLLRIASFADPASMAIRLEVARSLLTHDYADEAFEQASMVPPGSPLWADAQGTRTLALLRMGRQGEAISYARALAARPGAGLWEWRMLGDVLMQTGQYAEAAQNYARALTFPGADRDSRLLLQHGSALVQGGNWAEGKAALEQALARNPDEPVILNYLGYSLAERGEELPRALAMLQKAVQLKPGEPAYVDSLGWALFRSGQAAVALPYLEKAAMDAPGETDIQEHLGDVLWALGRRYEARYAWTAARVYASDDVRARLDQKISVGPAS